MYIEDDFYRVLRQEATALSILSNTQYNIKPIVQVIASTRGRVIVTGVGKSGHIARKMASTLASLGVAAFFICPTDAAHGDLGVLQQADTVIFLSKSGKTDELIPITDRCLQIGAEIVAICGNLGIFSQFSCHILQIPEVDEACHLGLAPTTSTTMMLALCDALAVAVSRSMHFTIDEFVQSHPGGTLGHDAADSHYLDDEVHDIIGFDEMGEG